MLELKRALRTVDLPYTLRLYGVTEAMFDEMMDEDTKAELLDGVMIVHSPASPRHDYIGHFLRTLMSCYAEELNRGRVLGPDSLIHLAACRLFAPDIFFIPLARLPRRLPKKQFEVTPDLIVEILSASNRDDDLEDKRPAYQQARVGEIWFVDPVEELVIIDRRRKRSYVTETVRDGRIISTALEGFWIEAAWLWQEPLPKVLTCLRQILK